MKIKVLRDEKNQEALTKATQELLNTKVEVLLKMPDYGLSTIMFNGKDFKYAWWKYTFSAELSHIIQLIQQETVFGFYYKFLSGVKIINKKEILELTEEEIANYD